MKLATWIEALEVTGDLAGHRVMTFNPVLFNDGTSTLLVDTCMPWHFPMLQSAIESLGVELTKLQRIVITHQDIDHISNAGRLKELSGATVMAHPGDAPYIQGEQHLMKLSPKFIETMLSMIPEAAREAAKTVYNNPSSVQVDHLVSDGEIIPIGAGVQVIHTPGHTPGHISLYVPSEKLLIAGDALRVENGQLVGPNKGHTPDMTQAMDSVRKLAKLNIDKVFCYHGGLFGPNAGQRLTEIAESIV
jgi:glyoxylase-like metal-dependent hydrolase (beta-lactamase superfamily II)